MKVVCFGDSLTACGGENGRFSDILAERFPGHDFVNRGIGGETLVDGLGRLQSDVLAEEPDIVLVEFGANDWWGDERSPAAWAADLEKIVRRVRASGAQVVLLGVFGDYLGEDGRRISKEQGIDARAIDFRQHERRIALKHGCRYVANIQETIIGRRTCWRDLNHPNEYGNRHVADAIESILEEMLRQQALPVRKPVLRTTYDMWREAVALAPDRPAAVDGERRLTFREADQQVEHIAANLMRLSGVSRPKVALFLPNCLEYFLVYWAVARLGGVVVPLNTWLKEDSLAGILRSVRPEILVIRSRADRAALDAARAGEPRAVVALTPGESGLAGWDSLVAQGSAAPDSRIESDALSIIMHTSGTTATPKGAVMRHCDLLFNVMAAINAHQFCESDVHLLVNPMFHCTALYSSLPTAAYTKTPVIIASATDPSELMSLVEKERVTTFLSIPSVFRQILKMNDLDRYDASSLRLIAYAGSPMPAGTIRQLVRRFPETELHNFFGLTETISMTHVLTGEEAKDRPDSIGRLLPFVEARVADQNAADVPAGTTGEMFFARENVIAGYYNQPGQLAESVITHAGREWFRTGDLAVMDEEGYFFIRGRKKDMIIVGGENVYATEVESVLLSHEKVREAAVKGARATGAASFLGERVEAYVVRSDSTLTEPELRRHCFERLPSYKVPYRVVFLDRLPRNPSGKVVKGELHGGS